MTDPTPKPGLRYSLPFAIGLVCVLGGVVAFSFVLLFSSVYSIDSGEVGVVLRFGKYRETAGPGFGLKAPVGIDQILKIPVDREMKLMFGMSPGQLGGEGKMTPSGGERQLFLTADLDEVSVAWTTAYKISDPLAFLFKNRNIVKLFGDMNESCVSDVVSGYSSEELVASAYQTIAEEIEQQLQRRCDRYETGLNVVWVELHSIETSETLPERSSL
jgi:membrane protease subunit HflK